MAARPDEKAMISEKVAPVLVARTLGPFDLVVIFVAIVLFINNAAGLQFAGPSVFVFWIVAFATFLITGAFVTAQLGRMFPEEGSLYVWTHKVLGPFWGFFAGFVAWWPGPISLVFIGILFANYLQQFAVFANSDCEFPCIFTENWQIGIVVLAVIWFSALMSYLKMRVTQNYVNVLFWFYGAAIFLIGFAGVWWLLPGQRGVHRLRDGVGPVPRRRTRAGAPREPHVLLVRDPGAPRDRDAAEHGCRGDRRREGDPHVPALGLLDRDGRVPLGDLGEHGRDRGRRGERDHRRRRVRRPRAREVDRRRRLAGAGMGRADGRRRLRLLVRTAACSSRASRSGCRTSSARSTGTRCRRTRSRCKRRSRRSSRC